MMNPSSIRDACCGICFEDIAAEDLADCPACSLCSVRAHVDCSHFLPSELPPSQKSQISQVFRVKFDAEFNQNLCGVCQTQRKRLQQRAGSSSTTTSAALPPPSNQFPCNLCLQPGDMACLMPVSGAGRHFVHVCCARFSVSDTSLVTVTGSRAYTPQEERECAICHTRRGVTTRCAHCSVDGEYVHVFCALRQHTKYSLARHDHHDGSRSSLVCTAHKTAQQAPSASLNELLLPSTDGVTHFCGVCLLPMQQDAQQALAACDGCGVWRHAHCGDAAAYCSLCSRRNSRGEPARCKLCPHVHTLLASAILENGDYVHEFCTRAATAYPAASASSSSSSACALCASNKGHLSAGVHPICLALASSEFRQAFEAASKTDAPQLVLPDDFKAVPVIAPEVPIGTGFLAARRPLPTALDEQRVGKLLPAEEAFLAEYYASQAPPPSNGNATASIAPDLQLRVRSAIAGAWLQTKPASHHHGSHSHHSKQTGTPYTTAKKRKQSSRLLAGVDANPAQDYFTRSNAPLGALTLDDRPLDMNEAWQILEPYFRRAPNVDEMRQYWAHDRHGDDLLLALQQQQCGDNALPALAPNHFACLEEKFNLLPPAFSTPTPAITTTAVRRARTVEDVQRFVRADCILFNDPFAAVSERHSALWMLEDDAGGKSSVALAHAMYYAGGSVVQLKLACASEEEARALLLVALSPPASPTSSAVAVQQVIYHYNQQQHETFSLEAAKQRIPALAAAAAATASSASDTILLPPLHAATTAGSSIDDRIATLERELLATKKQVDDTFAQTWVEGKMNLVLGRMQTIRARAAQVEAPYLTKKRRVWEKIRAHERKLQLEKNAACYLCGGEDSTEANPILICDGMECTVAAHQLCVKLDAVPEEDWFCDRCVYKRTGVRPPPRSPERVPLLDAYKDLRGLRSRRSLTLEDKLKETTATASTSPPPAAAEAAPAPPVVVKRARSTPQQQAKTDQSHAAAVTSTTTATCMCNNTNYVEGMLMLCCDDCSIWYHPECIHLKLCPSGHENCVIYKQRHTMDLCNWRFKCPRCCHQSNPVLTRLANADPAAAAEEGEEEVGITSPNTKQQQQPPPQSSQRKLRSRRHA